MRVRCASPEVMPGTDFLRAAQLIDSELAAPHLAALPELPGRGHHSALLGRSVAQLSELYAELTSYGWRLVQRPGTDDLRARTSLRSDVDTLADIRGERAHTHDDALPALALHILGPLSLAARLHLPSGEKVLIDHEARRDLAGSLAAGLTGHIAHVLSSVRPRALTVVLLEPEYQRVRTGSVPTVSGYQSIRSLHRDEARGLIGAVAGALRQAGADEVILDFGHPVTAEQVEDFRGRAEPHVDGFALPVHRSGPQDWERTAELVESGAQVMAGLLRPEPRLPEVSELTARITEPWQRLGMPASSLVSLTVSGLCATERHLLAQWGETAAMRALTRLRGAAEALTDQIAA